MDTRFLGEFFFNKKNGKRQILTPISLGRQYKPIECKKTSLLELLDQRTIHAEWTLDSMLWILPPPSCQQDKSKATGARPRTSELKGGKILSSALTQLSPLSDFSYHWN